MTHHSDRELDKFIRDNAPLPPDPKANHEQLAVDQYHNSLAQQSVKPLFPILTTVLAAVAGILLITWTNLPTSDQEIPSILVEVISDYGQGSLDSLDALSYWDQFADEVVQ